MMLAFALVSCCLVGLATGFVFKPPCETQQHTCYAETECPMGTEPLESLCFNNEICCVGAPQCTPDPCINGTCAFVDGANTCNCDAGFSGPTCDVDACADPTICQNGGTCERGTASPYFTCACAPGYTGNNCETDACAGVGVCINGGTCNRQADAPLYNCGCAPGFTGANCETNLCEPNPCNSGTCDHSENVPGYACTCTDNYFGLHCDQNLCLGNPCDEVDSDANCTYPDPSNVQEKMCVCNEIGGFHGELCELNVCSPDPCFESTCTNMGNTDYSCECPFNRTGKNCTESVCPSAALECNSRGTCVPVGEAPTCDCDEGFFGENCESEVPPCGLPITSRIFGGEDDVPSANPWIVKIVQTITGDVFCSGTLVGAEWVVLDGYCAVFCNGGCHVLLGDYNGTVEEPSQLIRNMSVTVHGSAGFSDFGSLVALSGDTLGYLPYNVALGRLSEPVDFTIGVLPVCPPSDAYNVLRSPRNCKVAGYGKQNAIDVEGYANSTLGVRQVLDATILDDAICGFLRDPAPPTSTHCGFSLSDAVVCNGDNGAALVCQNDTTGVWTIEGTVTYLPDNAENSCARTFYITDMTMAWTWIQQQIDSAAP
ncbi:fibropellin-1-like [Haliotis rufescens]|uniref:fibropellin-1-like n=1 Tax=Haliotis rufescens TaxID=6454 RepID=UPI00201F2EA1|nr:fibropellin-1-like [Haliotis rufescens]